VWAESHAVADDLQNAKPHIVNTSAPRDEPRPEKIIAAEAASAAREPATVIWPPANQHRNTHETFASKNQCRKQHDTCSPRHSPTSRPAQRPPFPSNPGLAAQAWEHGSTGEAQAVKN